jgi:hypothetical protein
MISSSERPFVDALPLFSEVTGLAFLRFVSQFPRASRILARPSAATSKPASAKIWTRGFPFR